MHLMMKQWAEDLTDRCVCSALDEKDVMRLGRHCCHFTMLLWTESLVYRAIILNVDVTESLLVMVHLRNRFCGRDTTYVAGYQFCASVTSRCVTPSIAVILCSIIVVTMP